LLGKTVTVGMKRNTMSVVWQVIEHHVSVRPLQEKLPTRSYGLKDFNFEDYKKVRF
jgi:hypothetical protein